MLSHARLYVVIALLIALSMIGIVAHRIITGPFTPCAVALSC